MARFRTLVELDLDGEVHAFVHAPGASTGPLRVASDSAWATRVPGFRGGIEVRSLPSRVASLFGGGGGSPDAQISLSRQAVDLWALAQKIPLQRSRGRILWWEEGTDYQDAMEIHRGLIRSPSFNVPPGGRGGSTTFSISPATREMDARFPPAAVADEGRFPDAPDRSKAQVVPIVYGEVRGVPLYAVSDVTVNPIRLLLAGHPIATTDMAGLLRRTDGSTLPAGARPVGTAIDALGGVYSYCEVTQAEYAVDNNIFATSYQGWVAPGGAAIDRLGDVLLHAWRQYAGEPEEALDLFRAEYARPRLNRYRVGAAFNARDARGTLIRALESRFVSQFPVVFGFVGGRLGWDAIDLPDEEEALSNPLRTLTFGADAVARESPKETSADDVRDDLRLEYALDGYQGGAIEAIVVDPANSELARAARSRWGIGPRVDLSAPDCTDAASAYRLTTDQARKLTEVRTRLGYLGCDASWRDVPLLGVVHVTDSDLSWERKPCLIEAVQPRLDGRVDVALITY